MFIHIHSIPIDSSVGPGTLLVNVESGAMFFVPAEQERSDPAGVVVSRFLQSVGAVVREKPGNR